MPRPPVERTVGGVPEFTLFKPAGVPARELERLQLAVDELEAIRLVDLEGLSHEQAAAVMGVSRQTVGRVLEHGRAQVAEALVTGKAILIGGGQYRVEPRRFCCSSCGAAWSESSEGPSAECPVCASQRVGTCWHSAGHEGAAPGGRGRRRGFQGGGQGCRRREAPKGPAADAPTASPPTRSTIENETKEQRESSCE